MQREKREALELFSGPVKERGRAREAWPGGIGFGRRHICALVTKG